LNVNENDLSRFAFELRNYQSADANQLAEHYQSKLVYYLLCFFSVELLLNFNHNSIRNGLTSVFAANRLREDGPNITKHHKELPKWVKVLVSLCSGF
jgi:hypothetical protein